MLPLTPYEQMMIGQDYESILTTGSESVVATFEYLQGAVPLTYDDTYGTSGYSSVETKIETGMVLQEFIKPRNEKTLAYGVLSVQDCILYASTGLNLNIGIPGSLRVVIGNVRWRPVPKEKERPFYNYLISRLGNLQVGQVIACKLEQ